MLFICCLFEVYQALVGVCLNIEGYYAKMRSDFF